jgi:hypothetical protein
VAENNPDMPLNQGEPVFRIAVRGVMHGQSTLSYFYYRGENAVDPAPTRGALASAFWTTVGQAWCAAVSADWALSAVIVRLVNTYGQSSAVFLPSFFTTLMLNVVGARGAACPPQDAVVVAKRTLRIGKKSRGRVFFPGIAEADQTSGMLSAGQANWDSLAVSMTQTLVVPDAVLMIPVHAFWREVPATPPFTEGTVVLRHSDISTCTYDLVIRSQRRRQIGRGI